MVNSKNSANCVGWHFLDSCPSQICMVCLRVATVLGRILFLIYINDIVENITSSICLFADDCLLSLSTVVLNSTVLNSRD